jgi:predicted DNA-binding ribbon-helix-helix protein
MIKRSVTIAGHRTSVSLEEPFWKILNELVKAQHTTLAQLIGEIDKRRKGTNLSSAIRIYVLESCCSHALEKSLH